MAALKEFHADRNAHLIDRIPIERSRRAGERAVMWLVAAFALFAILVLAFAVARSRTEKPPSERPPANIVQSIPDTGFRVVRILDGDTLVIMGQDNIELALRLAGIDAPEKDQPFGDEATRFLEEMLHGQIVQLDNVKRDKFGRVLAHAYLGTRWVDLEIVQRGWGWVYPNCDSRVLRQAEAKARSGRVGLWSSDPLIPPWEWRKKSE